MVNRKLKCGMALMLSIAMAVSAVQPAARIGSVSAAVVTAKDEVVLALTTQSVKYNGKDLVKATVTLVTADSGIQAYGVFLNYDKNKLAPVVILNEDEELDEKYYNYSIKSGSLRNMPGPYNYDEKDKKGIVNTQYTDIVNMKPITEGNTVLFIAYFEVVSSAYGKAEISVNKEETNFSGTGVTEAEQKTVNISADSGTLSVNYDTGIASAKVTFDANGGTFGGNSKTLTSDEVKAGTEINIPTEVPTNGKAVFLGWSTDKDAAEAEIGKDVKSVKADKNVTYYAVWGKPALENVTVSVSGTPVFGETLTASAAGAQEDAGTVSYQWYRGKNENGSDKTAIAGAAAQTYQAAAEDVGNYLFAEVSYAAYSGSAVGETETAVAKAAAVKKPTEAEIKWECTDTTITVTPIEGAEYSLDGKNYQKENVFTELTPKTDYTVYVRYAATATNLASEAVSAAARTANPAPVVQGTLTAEGVYGTTLGSLEIKGTMVYDGEVVDGSFSWAEEKPEEIYPEAGETIYKAKFSPADTENYSAAVDLEVKVAFARKPITVTASSIEAEYGTELKDTDFTFEVDEADLVGDDTKEDLGLVLTANTTKTSPAGSYEIVRKNVENGVQGNYDITVIAGILTIKKADPSIALENMEETIGSAKGVKAVLTPETDDAQAVVEYNIGTAKDEKWTSEIPTKEGVYPVRAYLPEEKAGKNLNPVTVENAKTGTYTLKAASGGSGSGGSGGGAGSTGGISGGTGSTGEIGGSTGNTGSTGEIGGSTGNTGSTGEIGGSTGNTGNAGDSGNSSGGSESNGNSGNTGNSVNTDSSMNQPDSGTASSGDTGKEDPGKKKKTVKLNKKKATIRVGKSVKLKVKNTTKKIVWSSNHPKIAKVNKNGKVTGLKAGKATIKAKVKGAKGKKLTCKITVKKAKSKKKNKK